MADEGADAVGTTETPPQPMQVSIENEFVSQLLHGQPEGVEGTDPIVLKVQPDGTLRAWSLTIGKDENGNEKIVATELDGTAKQSLYGTSIADGIVGVRVEDTTHELKSSVYGTDRAGGATSALEVDAEGDAHITLKSKDVVLAQAIQAVANTEQVLYTAPAGGAQIASIRAAKEDGGSSRFDVGISPGGGALVPGEFLRNDTQLSRGSFDTIEFVNGLRLVSGDEIRVNSNDTDIGFTVIGEAF